MLSVLIHKVSEMKPQIRAAVEAELGRSLRDDEEVSIMAFEPHPAPTGESRRDAAMRARRAVRLHPPELADWFVTAPCQSARLVLLSRCGPLFRRSPS